MNLFTFDIATLIENRLNEVLRDSEASQCTCHVVAHGAYKYDQGIHHIGIPTEWEFQRLIDTADRDGFYDIFIHIEDLEQPELPNNVTKLRA